MDLRNYTITMGELLDNPGSRAVLQRRFGNLLSHPMVAMSRGITLRKIVEMAGNRLPKDTIMATIQELREL